VHNPAVAVKDKKIKIKLSNPEPLRSHNQSLEQREEKLQQFLATSHQNFDSKFKKGKQTKSPGKQTQLTLL